MTNKSNAARRTYAPARRNALKKTAALGASGVAVALGFPAIIRAQSDAIKGRLRANTEDAQRLGIFGAPSFIAGGELFWGNDRLEQALDFVKRA